MLSWQRIIRSWMLLFAFSFFVSINAGPTLPTHIKASFPLAEFPHMKIVAQGAFPTLGIYVSGQGDQSLVIHPLVPRLIPTPNES